MTTTIFSIASQKGGVGKSTTAINLSVGLARQNVSTLLVDLDPQANATNGLGIKTVFGSSIYSSLHGKESAVNQVMKTSQDNLHIIPSEPNMIAIEIDLSHKNDYLLQLYHCMQPLKKLNRFRVIILDSPPALGLLSMNSLIAADYLLIALQCEYLAMEGLQKILDVVNQIKITKKNNNINIGGVLMTMYDVRTGLSRKIDERVRSQLGDYVFETVIPRSIRLSEAPFFGQSIFDYDPFSPGSLAYKKLTLELIERFSLNYSLHS